MSRYEWTPDDDRLGLQLLINDPSLITGVLELGVTEYEKRAICAVFGIGMEPVPEGELNWRERLALRRGLNRLRDHVAARAALIVAAVKWSNAP